MITIRRATLEDASAAWRIRCQAIEKLCAGYYRADDLATWNRGEMPDSFPELVRDRFHLAILEGEVVGTGMISLKSGKIDAVFVSPERTRRGVGRALVSHLEAVAREAGLETVHLDSTLNAAEFYRACGFSGKTIDQYQSLRGVSLDCIPMEKSMAILRPMTTADLAEVAALGIRSKASWGYSSEEMAIFSEELTLSEEDLSSLSDAQVAIENSDLAGYVTLRSHRDGTLELEHLFVVPEKFGRGIGSILLEAALDWAHHSGAKSVTILSDPNAADFYLRKGAKLVGEHQSSIAGRSIPVLSMQTTETK